tara:strand:- start:287 stop:445 length:159 start_codon:yes stop_codon:yes gene_type:complete
MKAYLFVTLDSYVHFFDIKEIKPLNTTIQQAISGEEVVIIGRDRFPFKKNGR